MPQIGGGCIPDATSHDGYDQRFISQECVSIIFARASCLHIVRLSYSSSPAATPLPTTRDLDNLASTVAHFEQRVVTSTSDVQPTPTALGVQISDETLKSEAHSAPIGRIQHEQGVRRSSLILNYLLNDHCSCRVV